ncbi:MAG: hypothetical protein AAGE01_16590 [Pseudomonadota bacterium]
MKKTLLPLLFLTAGAVHAQAVAPPAPPAMPAKSVWADLDLTEAQREALDAAYRAHGDRMRDSREELDEALESILSFEQLETLLAHRPVAPPAPPAPPRPPRSGGAQ